MKTLLRPVAVLTAALLLVSTLAACGGKGASVSTNGSTSMEKVIGALNEQFMLDNPDIKATYDPTGSGTGIEAVKTGSCDVGLSSRALKPEEESAGLTGTLLALDGIAVVVHPDNPVADLTMEQLAQIYTGAITDWSQVGGAPGAIAPIGREAGSGTRDGFESVTGIADDAHYVQELTSTGGVLEAVRTNVNAIGYASLSSVGDNDRAVTVNGVPCSEATVLNGSYPIQRPFILVTRQDTPLSASTQKWFDYVTSPAAWDVISAAGAIPPAGNG